MRFKVARERKWYESHIFNNFFGYWWGFSWDDKVGGFVNFNPEHLSSIWSNQPTRSKSAGWSLVRWAVDIQSCCCRAFTVFWGRLTGADSLPDCARLSSGKLITILLGSEQNQRVSSASHNSRQLSNMVPQRTLCFFSTAKLNAMHISNCKCNSVKGKGVGGACGGFADPYGTHANLRHLANCCPSAGGLAGCQTHSKRPLFILLTHKNI